MTLAPNVAQKRAMLFSARLQFSPEIQPYRDRTIDCLVEQSLLIADQESGLTISQIEQQRPLTLNSVATRGTPNQNILGVQTPIISQAELQTALYRLNDNGRVEKKHTEFGTRYRLSVQAYEERQHAQTEETKRFSGVVDALFADAPYPPERYSDAFFECLCHIFARLSESYVQILLAKGVKSEILSSPKIQQAIGVIRQQYPHAKDRAFERAVQTFFAEPRPDYDGIKWRLAQNYYLVKALGLDQGGSLLSGEIFGNARFYLDTNVIFQAAEPRMQRHRSFTALMKACQRLNTNVYACQISLDEMRNKVGFDRELIQKVEDRIPDELLPRMRHNLYEIYIDEKHQKGEVNLDVLFESFINPMPVLRGQYDIELVDDPWFSSSLHDKVIKDLVQQILDLTRKRERTKSANSAKHDALLLEWIHREREAGETNTWLVTLDTLLPAVSIGKTDEKVARNSHNSSNTKRKPLAITLDALLQWLSPLLPYEADEGEIASIFAEAVKYQLLPQDGFFDLKDFRVFSDLNISVKDLPIEDVEGCILYLKANAAHLDPSKPQDLQQLGLEISRFLADPGRKYKQELVRLEQEKAQQEEELKRIQQESQEREEARQKEAEAERQREQATAEARLTAQQQEYEKRLEALEHKHKEEQEQQEKDRLKRSTHQKLAFCAILFVAITSTAIALVIYYSDQTKPIMDRLTANKEALGVVFVVELILFAFIIGRKGFQSLDFPGWEVWKSNPEKKTD